jgi:hypothetical protein
MQVKEKADSLFPAQPLATTRSGFSRLKIYDATVQNEWTPSGRSRPGERQARPCSVGGFHTEEEAGLPTFLATPLGLAAEQPRYDGAKELSRRALAVVERRRHALPASGLSGPIPADA